MSCCGNSNSLFSATNKKVIKYVCSPSGCSLQVLNGSNVVTKIDLCDFSEAYTQVYSTQIMMNSNSTYKLDYNISSKVQFLYLKVEYFNKNGQNSPFISNNEIPFLSYQFEDDSSTIRYIDTAMLLTTDNIISHMIPKIILTNSLQSYNALVTMIASTTVSVFNNFSYNGTNSQYFDLNVNSFVNVPINPLNFNLKFHSSTSGQNGYLLYNSSVIEVGSYFNSTSGDSFFVFDTHGVGSNGRIQWNFVTETGITKNFKLGSVIYQVKWIGVQNGIKIFGINTLLSP